MGISRISSVFPAGKSPERRGVTAKQITIEFPLLRRICSWLSQKGKQASNRKTFFVPRSRRLLCRSRYLKVVIISPAKTLASTGISLIKHPKRRLVHLITTTKGSDCSGRTSTKIYFEQDRYEELLYKNNELFGRNRKNWIWWFFWWNQMQIRDFFGYLIKHQEEEFNVT